MQRNPAPTHLRGTDGKAATLSVPEAFGALLPEVHSTSRMAKVPIPVLDSDVTAQPLHSCVGRAERNQMHCLKLWGDLSIWTRETPTAPLLLRLCQWFTVTHCYLFVICCLWLMNPIAMEYGKITIISWEKSAVKRLYYSKYMTISHGYFCMD